ncbi:MAG: peptidylprolyl isomerase [Desulfuromonadales bacterium]|nr:peptidylprolyl isomerase [Desulfuromonadales bacterium]
MLLSGSTSPPWRTTLSVIVRYLILLILAANLLACQEKPAATSTRQQSTTTAAFITVGSRNVSLEQFNRQLLMIYPDIDGLSAQEKLLLQQQTATQLIDRELILAEAARLDVRLSPDEFDAALAGIRGTHSREDFEQNLRDADINPDLWRESLRFRLLVSKITERVVSPRIEISETAMEAYYRDHREDFQRPAEVHVYQMLLASREEALEIKKHLQDGADFATLAKQHSLSPDSEEGGLLGYFSAGALPPEFDAVIFSLPLRQVSDPVESPYGFHLLLVDRKRNAGQRPFAAVAAEIRDLLYHREEEALLQQWLTGLRRNTEVVIDWEQILPN